MNARIRDLLSFIYDGGEVDVAGDVAPRMEKLLSSYREKLTAPGGFSEGHLPLDETDSIMTAFSSVVACLGGVGPGLGGAGPTETYAHFPGIAKSILIACMYLGRLEVYALVVVFLPSFWRT